MSAQHSHWHPHPHPPQSKNPHGHHHSFNKALRKGRPKSQFAHEHAITARYRPVPPPDVATPRIKRIWRAVHRWFPHAVSLGIFAYRKIAGSNSWSEHAWKDAWDMASPNSVKTGQTDGYLQAMVNFVRSQARKLLVTRVIHGDSSHKNHAHVDADPDHSGTPPRP